LLIGAAYRCPRHSMSTQRLLLLIAAVAALALVFGLPRIFEETNEAAVPPVQLREEAPTRTPDPPRRRERPRPTPTPEATAPPPPAPAPAPPPQAAPPPAPAPAPPPPAAPPPAGDDDDDDDGGEKED
jgi:hypothetical protein